MFETTRDFFEDAFYSRLENTIMLDIVLVLTGNGDSIPTGHAMYEFHRLTSKQRNYICCVLLERDADPDGWQSTWSKLEEEVFS